MARNVLARLFYPLGSTRRVLLGPIRGTRFRVASGLGVSFALRPKTMGFDAFTPYINRGDVVFDIGANRGQMALFFGRQVGSSGAVYSFEPVPEAFDDLVHNTNLNDLSWVHCRRNAVGRERGKATFLYDAALPTQGKLSNVEKTYVLPEAKAFEVDVVALDELLAEGQRPPAFMKIDVEGGAAEVLAGARMLLERFSPTIYVELHGPEEQLAINEHLIARGFACRSLEGALVKNATERWVSPLICTKPKR